VSTVREARAPRFARDLDLTRGTTPLVRARPLSYDGSMTAPTATLPRGVCVALATPVHADGGLDVASLERLVAHAVEGGVRGVCPVGSTGEGPRLTMDERLTVARRVRALLPGDVALVPAVAATAVAAVTEELQRLGDVGVSAVMVSAPSYYPLALDEAAPFYERLADASPVPILVYNIPMFTKVAVPVAAVATLAGHPRVVGIKDSSRDMEYLTQVVAGTRESPDFRVYTGTDTLLLASLVSGAHGTIAASANLVPELSVALCAAVDRGDLDEARRLQERLAAVVHACRKGAAPGGWKAALAERALCGPDCLPPAQALAAPLRRQLADELRALDVLPA